MSNEALKNVKDYMHTLIAEFQNPHLQTLFAQLAHGKMLRSRLIFTIAGVSQRSIELCGIVELIQLASLLHDDVIDEAMSRRGKSSLNALYGNKNAIMLGDALYAKAFFHLLSFSPLIAQSIAKSVCSLSSGEILDVFLSKQFNPSFSDYLEMIKQKTASLIAASAESSALLLGMEAEGYAHYGECLGIAFQMIDDILDLTQTQEVLGKPALSDFAEGKTTLPYIKLYAALPQEEKPILSSLHGKVLEEEQRAWIFERFERYGSIQESRALAKKYAQSALERLPRGYNPKLEEMIWAMIERSY